MARGDDTPPAAGHADSIASNETEAKQHEKKKSKRPASEWPLTRLPLSLATAKSLAVLHVGAVALCDV